MRLSWHISADRHESCFTLAWYYVNFLIFVEWLLYSSLSICWVINSTPNVSFLESLTRAYVWFENRKEKHLSWQGIKFPTILFVPFPDVEICNPVTLRNERKEQNKRFSSTPTQIKAVVLKPCDTVPTPVFCKKRPSSHMTSWTHRVFVLERIERFCPLRKGRLTVPSHMKTLKLSPCGETVCGRAGEIKSHPLGLHFDHPPTSTGF